MKNGHLRKLNGKLRVLRLSVLASDASRCTAVVQLLIKQDDGLYRADLAHAPCLVPVLSLGRQMDPTAGVTAGTLSLVLHGTAAGGSQLQTASLSADMFDASQMQAVLKDLMDMTVNELREELEARGQPRSGPKAWLRRTLHSAIVQARVCDVMFRLTLVITHINTCRTDLILCSSMCCCISDCTCTLKMAGSSTRSDFFTAVFRRPAQRIFF